MSDPAERRATYADLAALPDNVIGEILGGVLHAQPRPAPRHALASSELNGVLVGEFSSRSGGSGGWRILFEPELHLGPDVIVPDIAGWRLPRLETLPDTAYIALVPDWVCEVLSPATARTDRVVKRDIYAREEVSHLWLVDPLARTLEAFALQDERWVLLGTLGDDATVALPPFEALAFSLDRLWD